MMEKFFTDLFKDKTLEEIQEENKKILLLNKEKDITISFKSFYNGYDCGNRNLYIIWRNKQCLYVGISRSDIWNRWFGSLSPHIYSLNNDSFNSTIGKVISKNYPKSMSWKIEMRYIEDKWLNTEEINLIQKYRPLFNTTYSPKRNKKEVRLHNILRYGTKQHVSNFGTAKSK